MILANLERAETERIFLLLVQPYFTGQRMAPAHTDLRSQTREVYTQPVASFEMVNTAPVTVIPVDSSAAMARPGSLSAGRGKVPEAVATAVHGGTYSGQSVYTARGTRIA